MNRETKTEVHDIDVNASFFNWATDYFSPESGRLDRLIIKLDAYQDFNKQNGRQPYSISQFCAALNRFCPVLGYAYNPTELCNDKAKERIIYNVSGLTRDLIYIRSNINIPFNINLPL